MWTTILMVVYIIVMALLLVFGLHTYVMIWLYKRNVKRCKLVTQKLDQYPLVTIQLPVYNEKFVIERLVDYTTQIDYPKDKMEIQILDDSTDETLDISKRVIKKYAAQGYNIKLFHRTKRTGHKGGALREALVLSKGDFVAVFDADFIPAENFIKATLPYLLKDKKLGMVQTRWGHLNTEYSWLTKAQAVGVDGHFLIDQVARSGNNLFMNFNGTAGIWRKACIIDAGNWQDDTLTEDFDLSYRAELKGWKFHYVKDVVNPSELPVQMSAYKSQQFRWCKGSIQTALKLTGRVLVSKQPLFVKMEAVLHMTYYSVHPLMLLSLLLLVPILTLDLMTMNSLGFFLVCGILTISTMGPLSFYAFSQYALYDDWKRRLLWVPFMAVIGTGIAVNNTRAFLEAVIGKRSEFIRTPKFGIRHGNKSTHKKKSYKAAFNNWITMFFEMLFMLYSVFGMVMCLQHDKLLAIPFMVIYFISFAYVFFMDLSEEIESRKIKLVPEAEM